MEWGLSVFYIFSHFCHVAVIVLLASAVLSQQFVLQTTDRRQTDNALWQQPNDALRWATTYGESYSIGYSKKDTNWVSLPSLPFPFPAFSFLLLLPLLSPLFPFPLA